MFVKSFDEDTLFARQTEIETEVRLKNETENREKGNTRESRLVNCKQ